MPSHLGWAVLLGAAMLFLYMLPGLLTGRHPGVWIEEPEARSVPPDDTSSPIRRPKPRRRAKVALSPRQ